MERGERGLFKPGQSGNPAGRPSGSRNRFSEAFMRDIADTWQEQGREAMQKTALTDPARFVAICASLIPKDVSVTLSGRLESGLDDADREILIGVLAAIKQVRPEAGRDEALQFVTDAIHAHAAKTIEICSPVATALPSIRGQPQQAPETDSKSVI